MSGPTLSGQTIPPAADLELLLISPHVPAALTEILQDTEKARQAGDFRKAIQALQLTRVQLPWESPWQWHLRLIEATLNLEDHQGEEAWHSIQLGTAWRERNGADLQPPGSNLPRIDVASWLLMANVALANGHLLKAEGWVSEAVQIVEACPAVCVDDVLKDRRADIMTLLAAIRLAQGKLHESESLLQLAYDAHMVAGDMQQLVVDLMLLADVEHQSRCVSNARLLLAEALQRLDEDCDPVRHTRVEQLRIAVRSRLRLSFRPSTRINESLN